MTRVVLCTSGGLPGALVLERLLACRHVQVVGVIRSSRVLRARYGRWRGAWEHFRLSGLAYTLYLACTTALADALVGRSAVAMVAGTRRLPVLATADVNGPEGRAFLEQVQPDLLVSAFFNQRIGSRIAAIPRAGAVNIHPSLLPGFKGVDPVFFARLRGSPALGVTVHRIAPRLDSGDILAQEACADAGEGSVMRATALLFRRGAELLLACLEPIVRGGGGHPQPKGGDYDSWPSRAQVAALARKGVRLVELRDMRDLVRGRFAPPD